MDWHGPVICMYVCVGTVSLGLGPTNQLVVAHVGLALSENILRSSCWITISNPQEVEVAPNPFLLVVTTPQPDAFVKQLYVPENAPFSVQGWATCCRPAEADRTDAGIFWELFLPSRLALGRPTGSVVRGAPMMECAHSLGRPVMRHLRVWEVRSP